MNNVERLTSLDQDPLSQSLIFETTSWVHKGDHLFFDIFLENNGLIAAKANGLWDGETWLSTRQGLAGAVFKTRDHMQEFLRRNWWKDQAAQQEAFKEYRANFYQ